MTQACRHCLSPLSFEFLDLGHAPPSNNYLTSEELHQPEVTYPLRLWVCQTCRLVQTEDFASAETLFNEEYAYFSSTSTSWMEHATRYTEMIVDRLDLGPTSYVIEVASNDGYLLRNFQDRDIPCLGIEPTKSTAVAANALGIPVLQEFFGDELAQRLDKADLIIGNNVYAHVPDINDFTHGLRAALKPDGVITLEFPHLMRLVEFRQFDTVYHEHFSYLSLIAVERIFHSAGLRVFHLEELPTHGGSLRIFGCHENARHEETNAVAELRDEERARGMHTDVYYSEFQQVAEKTKNAFLRFLLDAKEMGKSVAAYGAAAKGNTLLNFSGVKPDLLPFVCDAAEAKIGKFLPGSHAPILSPAELRKNRPDYLIILPWNIAAEIRQQNADLEALGTRFVTAIPQLEIS